MSFGVGAGARRGVARVLGRSAAGGGLAACGGGWLAHPLVATAAVSRRSRANNRATLLNLITVDDLSNESDVYSRQAFISSRVVTGLSESGSQSLNTAPVTFIRSAGSLSCLCTFRADRKAGGTFSCYALLLRNTLPGLKCQEMTRRRGKAARDRVA